MLEGTLRTESLRVGTTVAGLNLTVRMISRYRARGTTPDQPEIWTTLDSKPTRTARGNWRRCLPGSLTGPAGM